ncbi:MAG TPA: sigma factor-like helix-turn-helix DNA-binding protein [Actinomycetota bacterium]
MVDSVLDSPRDVVRCLITYADWWQPATSSILQVGAARRGGDRNDGMRAGTLETLDERTELRRRVDRLDDRERKLLFLWYVTELPVGEIARSVGVSRRHCFRVRSRAIHKIVEMADDPRA